MIAKEIINQLAKDRIIETIITNVAKKQYDQTDQDLAQDLYQSLLEKDPEFVETLFNNDELQFFITRMVIRNVQSKTSPYYYTYKISQRRINPIDDETNNEVEN